MYKNKVRFEVVLFSDFPFLLFYPFENHKKNKSNSKANGMNAFL